VAEMNNFGCPWGGASYTEELKTNLKPAPNTKANRFS
jgi:hypothetical protein